MNSNAKSFIGCSEALPGVAYEPQCQNGLAQAVSEFNPFIAPACKISGLKSAYVHPCKVY